MIAVWVIIGIIVLLIIYAIVQYNGLVNQQNNMENAWAQIDVQLKRRHDLIPNLINTVKGYMHHERDTLDSVTEARSQAVSAGQGGGDMAGQAQAENALSETLRSLFAVSENYPDLKANQNFLALQEELSSTENKIGFARQFYNDAVMKLNNKIEMFPSNILAGIFNFREGEMFELEDRAAAREVPKVDFSA